MDLRTPHVLADLRAVERDPPAERRSRERRLRPVDHHHAARLGRGWPLQIDYAGLCTAAPEIASADLDDHIDEHLAPALRPMPEPPPCRIGLTPGSRPRLRRFGASGVALLGLLGRRCARRLRGAWRSSRSAPGSGSAVAFFDLTPEAVDPLRPRPGQARDHGRVLASMRSDKVTVAHAGMKMDGASHHATSDEHIGTLRASGMVIDSFLDGVAPAAAPTVGGGPCSHHRRARHRPPVQRRHRPRQLHPGEPTPSTPATSSAVAVASAWSWATPAAAHDLR